MNLSAVSLTDRDMLAHVQRGLARHGVDPSRLVIEVTETASISDMQRARDFCAGVQRLGCAVALDDFGAGFGSFHYLKHLPFRYLKIDGAFIRGLAGSPHDQLVVKALVGLVRGMGQRTIAEFVGDDTTLLLLRELGVDYAQGFRGRAAAGGVGGLMYAGRAGDSSRLETGLRPLGRAGLRFWLQLVTAPAATAVTWPAILAG